MLNKKMILSVLIIGCIATVAGAGTWAYYTSSANSYGNSFTAGNLKVTVDQEIGDNLVKPGETIGDKSIIIKNAGDLPIGNFYLTFSPSANDLSSNIAFDDLYLNGDWVMDGGPLSSLSSLTDYQYTPSSPVQPGETLTITLTNLRMDPSVTDGQGEKSTLVTTVTAEQQI